MGIWRVSRLRLVQIVLLRIFSNMSLEEYTYILFSGIHLGTELLNHKVCVFSRECQQFSKMTVRVYIFIATSCNLSYFPKGPISK